jgi:hypothetical protein
LTTNGKHKGKPPEVKIDRRSPYTWLLEIKRKAAANGALTSDYQVAAAVATILRDLCLMIMRHSPFGTFFGVVNRVTLSLDVSVSLHSDNGVETV